MDRNVIILVFLVVLYVISKMIADKIQMSDCQDQLVELKGASILDTKICCTCALEEIKKSEFKILDEQIKNKGISILLTNDDPLLETFDAGWTTCVKNKSNNAFSFSAPQKDSLSLVCKKEYEGTGFEKEVDVTQFCNCYVENAQKNISVRELLKVEMNFSDDRAINDKCITQSKIVIDTIQ